VRRLAVFTLATGLAVTGVAGPAAGRLIRPTSFGPDRITADLFGTHHWGLGQPEPRGWPQAPIGAVRLWDNGVSWREIETAPGTFDWSRTDALIAQARSHGASVLLVLGQTPQFYSSRPEADGAYGPGSTAMPASQADWARYVTAVARRNVEVWGGGVELQVWNEANVVQYWTGTPQEMALLTRWTREALRAAGSTTRLVAPALATRLTSQRTWVDQFYAQRIQGRGPDQYVDVLSFQLYPQESGDPEEAIGELTSVRRILDRRGVADKPIYATEINYGLHSGSGIGDVPQPVPDSTQQSNVARTFLLAAQSGVTRVYWYSWDLQNRSNTPMVLADNVSLTAAGRTFGVIRSWLVGTVPRGCTKTSTGTHTCTFQGAGGSTRRAVWNPVGRTQVDVPRHTTAYETVDGVTHSVRTGDRVSIGEVPVLLYSRR